MDAAGERALRWLEELWAHQAVHGLVRAGLLTDGEDAPAHTEAVEAIRREARRQRRQAEQQVAEARRLTAGAQAMRERVASGRDQARAGLAEAHAALGDVLAAQALRAQATVSLDEVVARSRHPVLLADDERRILDANEAAARLLGVPRDELLGRQMDDLLPPADRDSVDTRWPELLDGHEGFTCRRLLRADGEVLTVGASAMADVAPGRHLLALEPSRPTRPPNGSASVLRPREREIIGLVATGATSADIAARLVLSPATVESHIRNAVMRLGARNRTHASILALQRGEIALQPPGPPPGPATTAGEDG